MIPLQTIIMIVLLHTLGDFVGQSDWMAKNKHKAFDAPAGTNEGVDGFCALVSHVGIYTLFLIPLGVGFAVLNGLAHFMVDLFTSPISHHFIKDDKKQYHQFFVVVGFDQAIHLIVLFATWYAINKPEVLS